MRAWAHGKEGTCAHLSLLICVNCLRRVSMMEDSGLSGRCAWPLIQGCASAWCTVSRFLRSRCSSLRRRSGVVELRD